MKIRCAAILGAIALSGALTAGASAQEQTCVGLECAGIVPSENQARGSLPTVEDSMELERHRASGFYDFGSENPDVGKRAVAYVASPSTCWLQSGKPACWCPSGYQPLRCN